MFRRALWTAILGGCLSGAVLVDSWILPAPALSEREGGRAPAVDPELATPRAPGLRPFENTGPSAEPVLDPPFPPARLECAPVAGSAEAPVRSGAVDPSGWLGRRHSRSPA